MADSPFTGIIKGILDEQYPKGQEDVKGGPVKIVLETEKRQKEEERKKTRKPPSWGEVESLLDPLMPKDQYDKMRENYFNNFVAPSVLEEGKSVWRTREEFMKQTERAPILQGKDRVMGPILRGINAAKKEIAAPIASIEEMSGNKEAARNAKRTLKGLDIEGAKLDRILQREGLPSKGPEVVGSLVGAGVPIAVISALATPATAALFRGTTTALKTASLARKALRGGVTFATYEALKEQDADLRFKAGMEGFAIGATFDMALAGIGVAGRAGREKLVERALKRIKEGEIPTTPIEEAVDKGLAESSLKGERAGAKLGHEVSIHTTKSDIAALYMTNPNGIKGARTISIKSQTGRDEAKELLEKGWSIDDVRIGEDNFGIYQEFKAELGEKAERWVDMYLPPGVGKADPEQIAAAMRGKGFLAEATKDGGVKLGSALSATSLKVQPTPRMVKDKIDLLRKAGKEISAEEEARLQHDIQLVWQRGGGGGPGIGARQRLNMTIPEFLPPTLRSSDLPTTAAEKVVKGQLVPSEFPEGIADTSEILTPAQIETVVRRNVSDLTGLWSNVKGRNLTREEVLTFARRAWNPGLADDIRADAIKILEDAYPQILPEKFFALPEHTKKALQVTKRVKEEVPPTSLSETDRKVLEETTGKSTEELLEELEREFPPELEVPAAEAEIAEVMKSEIDRGILGPAAKARGVKRGKRGDFKPDQMIAPLQEDIQAALPSLDEVRGFSTPRERQLFYTAELPTDHPSWQGGKVQGMMSNSYGSYLLGRGFSPNQIPPEYFKKPLLIFPEGGWSRRELWHEAIHGVTESLQFDWFNDLQRRGTGLGIALGLKRLSKVTVYKDMDLKGLLNEAFTYGATAVRLGHDVDLVKFAKWDTSVQHVIDFVGANARQLLKKTYSFPDSALVRRAQRTFSDLDRRTAVEVSGAIEGGMTGSGHVYFDEGFSQWVLNNADGTVRKKFNTTKELWDYMWKMDAASETVPSFSYIMEEAGLRGPLVPESARPGGRTPPLPSTPIDLGRDAANWGWQALRGWTRPFFAWTATLDAKLNKFFAAKGQSFPLNSTVRALDDAHRASLDFKRLQQTSMVEAFKNLKKGKGKDLFEWLSYSEADRALAAQKYKIGPVEEKAGRMYEAWEEKFRQATGINAKEYRMSIYPQLKKNGFNYSTVKQWGTVYKEGPKDVWTWEKAIREDQLFDPRENDLPQFANFLIEEAVKKKYTGAPIKALEKLINRQAADGRYILNSGLRGPLNNYVNYMKGYPDSTQQALNGALRAFQDGLGKRIVELNKHLPAKFQIPIPDTPPQQTINRFLLLSYAAGLAGRPAANLRDLMQGLVTGMTVIGPNRYWKAVGEVLGGKAKAWDKAEAAGALLSRHDIGELWGDIWQELPAGGKGLLDRMTKLSNTLLQPQRWTDNFNRAVIFTSEKNLAVEGLRLLRAKKIDPLTFIEKYSTLWWNDESNITRMLDYAMKEWVPKPSRLPVVKTGEELALRKQMENLEILLREKKITKNTFEIKIGPLNRKLQALEAAPKQKDILTMEYKGITAKTEAEYLDKVSDKIANELIDLTMWPYRKGGQPAVLRTGLGRIFGQYGMYPMNYLDFMRRGTAKFISNPSLRGKVMMTAGLWAGVNWGAVKGLEVAGAEASQWFWASPGAYIGGPNMQFVQDLVESLEASDKGREARSRVLRYPVNFIPMSGAMRNIIMSLDAEGEEGLLSPAVIRVLGLRPKEVRDEDLGEYIYNELGLAPARRR